MTRGAHDVLRLDRGAPQNLYREIPDDLIQPLAITSFDDGLNRFDRFSQVCMRFQRLRERRQIGGVGPSLGLP